MSPKNTGRGSQVAKLSPSFTEERRTGGSFRNAVLPRRDQDFEVGGGVSVSQLSRVISHYRRIGGLDDDIAAGLLGRFEIRAKP